MSRAKPHSFPPFYACYLLQSLKPAYTSKIYIGSALNPYRRLKQHNGILPQGARGTTAYRPWAMQLLVYGFPSKPAVLTFEWAWQHPHKSRFLRDDFGNPFFSKRGTLLEQNIMVLQKMICTHPFSTWPLHVKLFTEQADYCWQTTAPVILSVSQDTKAAELPFPPGFTCSVELEGVDGSSGILGTGRKEPISVTDEQFTSTHLTKHTALIASGSLLSCSICKKPINDYGSNHLETTLCTASSCTAVSHLKCLASSFLEQERHAFISHPQHTDAIQTETQISKRLKGMVPRGGNCNHCNTYALWGDIIKGCYRRLEGSDNPMKLKKTRKKKVKVQKEESAIGIDTDVGVVLQSFDEMEIGKSSLTSLETSAMPVKKRGIPKKLALPIVKSEEVELSPKPKERESRTPKKIVSPVVKLKEIESSPKPKKRGQPRKIVMDEAVLKTEGPDKPQESSSLVTEIISEEVASAIQTAKNL